MKFSDSLDVFEQDLKAFLGMFVVPFSMFFISNFNAELTFPFDMCLLNFLDTSAIDDRLVMAL